MYALLMNTYGFESRVDRTALVENTVAAKIEKLGSFMGNILRSVENTAI